MTHKAIRVIILLGTFIAGPVIAADIALGTLLIKAPWIHATPAGAQVAGGYMSITNAGKEADRLIGGSLAQAGAFQIHEMSMVGGVMKMRELSNGLEIAAGATVEIKPGSYHVMFTALKEPIEVGAPIKGTLVFEKAGTVDVEYKVAPIGAKALPSEHGE